MNGLTVLERTILEIICNNKRDFFEILEHTGLNEGVCFNILQSLIMRGIITTDNKYYSINKNISPDIMNEINGPETKLNESLEIVESIIKNKKDLSFKIQKVALDERDEKIFRAMMINLEQFLTDAHKKSSKNILHKNYNVVFWGMGQVDQIARQIISGE